METSYVNKITGFVIALVLGAILVGGMLAPTVAGIQDHVGTPVTKYNSDLYNRSTYLEVEDISITFDAATSIFNVNGFEFTFGAQYDGNPLVISKDYSLFMFNTTNRVTLELYETASTTKYVHDLAYDASFEAANGEYTFTYTPKGTTTETTYSNNYTGWSFAECAPDTPKEYVSFYSNGLNTHYISGNVEDMIILSSAITLAGGAGEYYTYRNGVESYTENMDVSWTLDTSNVQTVSGTTDIYSGYAISATVNGTSQQIVVLLPNEVKGHADSGPAYVMFGVITLLAIVMLVVIAANAVRGKYN